jgi:hypothetical protein
MSFFILLLYTLSAFFYLVYTISTSCFIILLVKEILLPLSIFVIVLSALAKGEKAKLKKSIKGYIYKRRC